MFFSHIKKIRRCPSLDKKMRRIYSDSDKINITHKQFRKTLHRMSKTQRAEIIAQIRDQQHTLRILEQAEYDPSPVPTENQYQQQFYERSGWYYPDEDYIDYTHDIIKGRY